MQANVRVIRATDFLLAQAVGAADVERGERLLAWIAVAAAGLEEFEVLIDLRDVTGLLSPQDVERMAEAMGRHRDTFRHKTALLGTRERFENLRLFADLTGKQGLQRVRPFLTYEDAMDWLMDLDP